MEHKGLEPKLFSPADPVATAGEIGGLSASSRDARDIESSAKGSSQLPATFTTAEAVGEELLSRACVAKVHLTLSAFGTDAIVVEEHHAAPLAAAGGLVPPQGNRFADLGGSLLYAWTFIALKPSRWAR